jgi:hypothetical protein
MRLVASICQGLPSKKVNYATIVHQKSRTAAEYDTQINKAVLGVQSRLYKSLYKAAKQLGLSKDTVTHCINRGLLHSQACQQQQKLSYAQENILFKSGSKN